MQMRGGKECRSINRRRAGGGGGADGHPPGLKIIIKILLCRRADEPPRGNRPERYHHLRAHDLRPRAQRAPPPTVRAVHNAPQAPLRRGPRTEPCGVRTELCGVRGPEPPAADDETLVRQPPRGQLPHVGRPARRAGARRSERNCGDDTDPAHGRQCASPVRRGIFRTPQGVVTPWPRSPRRRRVPLRHRAASSRGGCPARRRPRTRSRPTRARPTRTGTG